MLRPRPLGSLVLAAAAAAALAAPAPAARPNVVLVLTDDQRWDTLGAMPAVQRTLVRHGVTFTNAFVVNPLCCPSRASILTGAYSHATGVYRNRPPHGGFVSFRAGRTIATRLRGAGYRTAYVGKYMNGYEGAAAAQVPPGWDRWVALTAPGYRRYGLNVDGRLEPPARRPYSTDFLAKEAAAFVRGTRGPFFLVYAPYAPHAPFTPAARHRALFGRPAPWRPQGYDEADVSDKPGWVRALPRLTRRQRSAIDSVRLGQLRTLRAVDEGVARIVSALRASGRLRDTMVIFTSDNGFGWGEHRRQGKHVPYEESIRVPLVVRYDPLVRGARSDDRLALNIDLAPTLAHLAGTTMPGAEGASLLPSLHDPDAPGRDAFAVEHLSQPGSRPRPPTYCAVRSTRHAYVVYGTGEEELYDLRTDPAQLDNRAGEPALAATRTALRRTLARLCHPTPPGFPARLLCVEEPSGEHELTASAGADVVCGGPGDDSFFLAAGDDLARAGAGADLVDGGPGRDLILTGPGRDVVRARDGERDEIDCGRGRDTVFADRLDRVAASCERVSYRRNEPTARAARMAREGVLRTIE